MDRPTTPSLRSLLDRALDTRLAGLHVALPGRVVAYDSTRQVVDVQPLVMAPYEDELGERRTERLPIVQDAPLLFPGGGSYRMTWPVSAGDTVLLVVCSSAIGRWKLSGAEDDPWDDRRNHLSDAVAVPGLFDLAHIPTTAPSSGMVLHADDLRLGGPDALSRVVVEDALTDFMAALTAAIPSAGTAAQALTALKTALQALNAGQGWRARTTQTRAL